MPLLDLPLEELERYRPKVAIEPDFDEFWDETLLLAREYGGTPVLQRIDAGLLVVDTFDVTFPGWGGAATPATAAPSRPDRTSPAS